MGVEYNVYSPYIEEEEIAYDEDDKRIYNKKITSYTEKLINLINKIPAEGIDARNAKGSFTYQIKFGTNRQIYHVGILNIYDAMIISALLIDRSYLIREDLPIQYKKIYDLFENANLEDYEFAYKFKNDLDPWISPKTKGRKKAEKQVLNPVTKRYIKIEANTYKKVFRNIPLKKVTYQPLENYKIVDYEVDKYCVPSYLSKFLLKKEFKVIEDELKETPTPMAEELEKMLNKIGYNLCVYITDDECISEQTKFKKTLKIMIHDEHMFVLKNVSNKKENCKVKEVDKEDFDKINSEIYDESTKIKDGVKYKICDRFAKIEKYYNLKNSFSMENIKFYEECGIRATRYINMDIDNIQSLDLEKCYFSILNNDRYIFPVQNGEERTEVFKKGYPIIDTGFYYVHFKNMDDIEESLFNVENCWVLGYLINKLKLKVDIKYQHIPNGCSMKSKDKNDNEYMDVIHYTGTLSKYKKTKSQHIQCIRDEKEAYMMKYKNCYYSSGYIEYKKESALSKLLVNYDSSKEKVKYMHESFDTYEERDELLKKYNTDVYINPTVNIEHEYFLQKSGMYAYLAIMQYTKYELYVLYKEMIKEDPNFKIHKIYTDSMSYDSSLSDKSIENINKKIIKNYGFSVKKKSTYHIWNYNKKEIPEPIVKDNIEITNHDDINELLNLNVSFCNNSRAGYGKSHQIKNVIIPWMIKNDKKYILTSTTISSSEALECECINTILSSNDSHFDSIKNRFKDIDYLIVDECSRLNRHILKMIEYVKSIFSGLKVIMIGDINQCDYSDDNIMELNMFNNVVDYNFISIKYHNKARYDKTYDEFLTKILSFKNGGKDPSCVSTIKKFFKNQIKGLNEKDNNEIKITYTNKKGQNDLDNDYETTHKAQGKTISDRYSVYEINKMPRKVLYTALSRCCDYKLIDIYLN